MLKSLLDSLLKCKASSSMNLLVLVVENDSEPFCHPIISEYSRDLELIYELEMRPGLVCARNAAIDAFLKTDSDFLGFIDDDETVDSGWLVAMSDAVSRFGAESAYWGHIGYSENIELPGWYPKLGNRPQKTGQQRNSGATNNILIPRHVVSAEGWGIRFDPKFNFRGGEDGNFFARAMKRGLKVRNVSEAIIHTQPNPDRQSFGYLFRRIMRVTQYSGQDKRILYGWLGGIGFRMLYLYGCLIRVMLLFPSGLLLLPFREKQALTSFGWGFTNVARIIGTLRSFYSNPGEHYRQTDGE